MKKLILTLGVGAILVAYSFAIRHHDGVIAKPSSLSQSNNQTSTSGSSVPASSPVSYKDGTYTGDAANAYYGNVQVQAVISGGKLVSVNVLQYPSDHSTSVAINQQALPYLKQEAIQAQSAHFQIVSGATFTSQAYMQSLENALSQA